MSWFETIVVQPIFNILMALYSLVPWNDFGIAVVIFSVLVRLLMWPLIKKQLHQTKIQKKIQPELKRIKAKAAGNKQLEGQLMLELYKKHGVNPLAPIGVLLVQLPIFIALYQVIMTISMNRERIADFMYGFMKDWSPISTVIADTSRLNEMFLGAIDLTKPVLQNSEWYLPAFLIALVATFLQYYQSKQITPTPASGKRLRDIMKESANTGQQADQADISAAMGQSMLKIIPIIALSSMVFIPIPGALLLFYLVSSLVAVWQQRHILDEDVEEMEEMVEDTKVATSKPETKKASKRAEEAVEGEVVERNVPKPVQKRRKGSKVR